MIDMSERQDQRYDETTIRPRDLYSYDYGPSVYPEERRATNDSQYDRYASRASEDYNSYDYSPTFQPLDYTAEPESSGKRRAKRGKEGAESRLSKLSGKAKAMIVVYFALITLIVVMLSINAIPTADAQRAPEEPKVKVSESGYNEAMSEWHANSEVQVNPPYDYDTETNWFDDLCDKFGSLFG